MARTLRKILLGLFILLFVLLAAAAVVPIFFKKQIVELIKKEANNNLNATVNFNNNISLSVFKHFPDITLTIDSLTIANKGDFQGDTLADIEKISVSADIMSVISGDEIKIKLIQLVNPEINVRVLQDGRANYDITLPDTAAPKPGEDTSTTRFNIALKKVSITGGDIIYDDASLGVYTAMKDLDLDMTGDLSEKQTLISSIIRMTELTVGYGGINYLNKVKTELKADIDADLVGYKYTFKENSINLNDLELGFDGWVAMPDTNIDMDIKFAARKTDFRNFLSLVPAVYTKNFAQVKTSGKLGFNGAAKGRYNASSIPAFNLKLDISDGRFQYPDLPTALSNIIVKLDINNPDGVFDHTVVNLSRLHMEMGKDPFDARMLVKTPESDPYIDAAVKGHLDLAQVMKMVPMEGTTLTGVIDADASAKGNMSSIDKGEYEKFNAAGMVKATALKYASKDVPLPFTLNTGVLGFNPKTVSLSEFDALYGPSDFKAKGELNNFYGYILRDEVLKGSMNLQSKLIDANSMMAEDPSKAKPQPEPKDTMPLTVFEVPGNIDFGLGLNIQKMVYSNMVLENVKGDVKIADQALALNGLGFDVFKGKVNMTGQYETKNPKRPSTDFKIKLAGVDIPDAVDHVNMIKSFFPIARYARGIVNADFSLTTPLDEHMSPILGALSANGSLNLPNLGINNFKPLEELSRLLKLPYAAGVVEDKPREFSVKQLSVMFEILDGKMILKKGYDLLLAGKTRLKIDPEGYTRLDQSIAYKGTVSIPRSDLGKANSALENGLKQAASAGIKLNMDELINVPVTFGGTVTKPDVKLDLASVKDKMLGGLKDQLKQTIEEKKEEVIKKVDEAAEKALADAKAKGDKLIADAKKQADAIRAEAKKQSDAAVAEGDKQAEKVVKEAGSNPIKKLAAEKAAEKFKSEARKKADQINKEADKKATDVENKAQAEADKLYQDALNKKNEAKP